MRAAPPFALALASLAGLTVLLAGVSVLAGKVWFSPADAWAALVTGAPDLGGVIVRELRAPRAALAILVGGALGLSGAALQGLLRNPLAEPGVLGISTGASLGAVLALYYGVSSVAALALPLAGLIGAAATTLLVVALAARGGAIALILAGAAVSSFGGALVALALNLAPSPWAATEIMVWLMGSLADRAWSHVTLAAPFVLAGAALLLSAGRGLDALSLGEATAESLGVPLSSLRLRIVAGAALAVGAATAVSGAIGFVGLVAGHLVRPLGAQVPSRVLPLAMLAGASLVLAADIGARLMPFGPEVKLGVVTALVGAPFFFLLVLRARKALP
jgi:iron complex transport system permease protein